jgi:hypothetical protein
MMVLSAAPQSAAQALQRTVPTEPIHKKESTAGDEAQPRRSRQISSGEGGAVAADLRQNVGRTLADLDAIRDKYIDRVSGGKCPPAIVSRMAELKWKLGQKGVVVSNSRANTAPGDFLAISQEWFKASEAPPPEVRQACIEDILPAALMSSRRTPNTTRADDEDVNKMSAEYEALSAACSETQQPASVPGKEN